MEKNFKPNDKNQEAGEEQLFELGNEARVRKREAMARHFDKLRAAIAEGVLLKQDSLSI